MSFEREIKKYSFKELTRAVRELKKPKILSKSIFDIRSQVAEWDAKDRVDLIKTLEYSRLRIFEGDYLL